MRKVISMRDVSAIKKMAQIVNPLVSRKQTLLKKIEQLKEEIEGPSGLNAQIAGMEAGIKARFCGLGTEQLVKKVVTPAVREDGTPVLDAKTGKQLTKTTWETTECLTFDSENKNYILDTDVHVEVVEESTNLQTVENHDEVPTTTEESQNFNGTDPYDFFNA